MAPDSGGFGAVASPIGDALVHLFVQADDARLLLDHDGIVVLANSRCQELLGWTVDDLVGAPAARLAPPQHHESYRRLREVMLGSDPGDVTHLDLVALHQDGREIRLGVTVRVIGLDDSARMLWLVLQPRAGVAATGTHIRELIEIVPDGNVVVDGGGRILMANAPAQAMFGYAEDDLVDQPLELLVPEAQRAGHVARRAGFTGHARRHAMGLGTRVAARRKDGTTFPVSVVISSIGTDDDVLFSATVRDLSEIEALRGSADAMRAQFMATISHELRTPLTTILASTELLGDELADGDDRARTLVAPYLARIERAARRELALVDDLLSLAVIEGEAERLGQGLTDLTHVAETVVSEFRPLAGERGLSIATASVGRPVVVRAHEGWLERAVRCLVDNAVKFTPAGGRIEVVSGADVELAWLEVRDTGPGIAPQERERVFDRLYRGADAVAAETAGAGLGLTIARSIVRATGGELVVVPDDAGARLRISAHARA